MASCGCHCIRCGSTSLDAHELGEVHADGDRDMHHTCADCGTHFDHLEGDVFESCKACGHSA